MNFYWLIGGLVIAICVAAALGQIIWWAMT